MKRDAINQQNDSQKLDGRNQHKDAHVPTKDKVT